jgi:transcriptional regulator with XRE-family HTH domain
MGKWEGLADRIKQRIAELGYKNPAEFADKKRYRITYIYKWVGGTAPDPKTLQALAKDLETTPEWLLFGDVVYERNRRRRGGGALMALLGLGLAWLSMGAVPAHGGTQYEPQVLDKMRLIGTRRGRLWPVLCTA